MSKFDAAIEVLKHGPDEFWFGTKDSMDEAARDMESAISVLNAAAKVDRENCLDYVHHAGVILSVEEVEAYAGGWNESEQRCEAQIIALLAAIPDGDDK